MSNQNKKFKILLGCLFYREFTGSEMYVYEVAKSLKELGHDISIISPNVNGPLNYITQNLGIRVLNFQQIPLQESFDVIHTQHYPVTEELLKHFSNTPFISSIHSEVLSLENPIVSEKIIKYIAIRPQIKTYITSNFDIDEKNVEIIYNPIDQNRFNLKETITTNSVLFVGTLDYLREKTIFDILNHTKTTNQEFWLVGKNHSTYLSQLLKHPHFRYFTDTRDVEKFTKSCGETAGILLGRTTIEGWMCGKKGWIYDVDSRGEIISKNLHEIPNDVEKFYSKNVINQIVKLYHEITK